MSRKLDKILILSSELNGITEKLFRFYKKKYKLKLLLFLTNNLIQRINYFEPDLILCPYMLQKLPSSLYNKYKCLIAHPGIMGD